jgi:hypothetical protein
VHFRRYTKKILDVAEPLEAAQANALETKAFDPLEELKTAAAKRWVTAVNAEGSYGHWRYGIAKRIADIARILASTVTEVGRTR